ncbi:MAG: hypothetical protein ACQEQC_08505 [Elusimicrobiota bacterium]
MSIIKDILSEEKERLEKLIESYKKEIDNLPRGYISIKEINDNKYAYRSYREKDKVKSIYLGKPDSNKVKEVEEQIKERKNYEKLLKQAKKNLEEVEKVVGK